MSVGGEEAWEVRKSRRRRLADSLASFRSQGAAERGMPAFAPPQHSWRVAQRPTGSRQAHRAPPARGRACAGSHTRSRSLLSPFFLAMHVTTREGASAGAAKRARPVLPRKEVEMGGMGVVREGGREGRTQRTRRTGKRESGEVSELERVPHSPLSLHAPARPPARRARLRDRHHHGAAHAWRPAISPWRLGVAEQPGVCAVCFSAPSSLARLSPLPASLG